VRIPIDSCDFSLGHYEADSDEADENFEKFSFERVEKYILPLLDAAEKAYGGKLDIMLSPWSPPVYMKTNADRNLGGKLKEEYRERWAEYICRYIEEYRNRGYKVTRLTMQNEPKAVQTWDSCIYTAAEEKEFLKDYMWPALVKHNLDDIEVYLWDHNKERIFEWAEEIIDEETTDMVAGMAFHWYSGDHFEALRMVKERFPDKKLLLSEACIEYSKFDAGDYLKNAQKYAHDMIGNLNEGMNTFIDWNLVLDEMGGPNHVKNYCDAPYLLDMNKKELREGNILGYLWHFAHFIEPGSVRIAATKYTDKLEVTAFQKEEKITVVILNRTDETIPAYIRLKDKCVEITVEPNSISTGIVEE
ncbi:MAG: glucosylceramidase, partial [Ruminococcus sp.]|nr:glucosylceramidase [Ruminococcus sp.]